MATKDQIFEYVKNLSIKNIVTREELVAAYDSGRKSYSCDLTIGDIVTNFLIYLGGLLIFGGVEFYFYKKNILLGAALPLSHGFLLSNFIAGIVFYIIGLLLDKKEDMGNITSLFYVISIISILIGGIAFLSGDGLKIDHSAAIVVAFLAVLYLVPFLVTKKNIFLFFTIICSTCLLINFISLVVESFSINYFTGIRYITFVIGIVYIILARFLLTKSSYDLAPWFYCIGSVFLLDSGFYLSNFLYGQSWIAELSFLPLIFIAVFSGFKLGSKSLVITAGWYMVAYSVKLASEYLVSNYGMAILPVVTGAVILIGLIIYHSFKTTFFVR